MNTFHSHEVGTYLVTPMTKQVDGGQFAASVSIRRGAYDRIFRLAPRFANATRAAHYALAQGRLFIMNKQLA